MIKEDFTVVVSGLPRSGTSVMMQMLAAGGVPLLADDERPPDADNPYGYFELQAVKAIARDPNFLDGASGKAVKIVHALLPHLPRNRAYRVIFMRRKLAEVLASQRQMLDRSGRSGAALTVARLKSVYESQLQQVFNWLDTQAAHIRVLEVDHAQLVNEPNAVARVVNEFVGGGLDVTAMAAVVDPLLHRQRC